MKKCSICRKNLWPVLYERNIATDKLGRQICDEH